MSGNQEAMRPLEAELRRLEGVDPTDSIARTSAIPDLIRVRRQLDEYGQAASGEELGQLEGLRRRYHQQATTFYERLQAALAAQLERFRALETVDGNQTLARDLAQARRGLADLRELIPAKELDPILSELQTRVEQLSRTQSSQERLEEVRQQVEDCWRLADQTVRSAPITALDWCKQAAHTVEGGIKFGGPWEPEQYNELSNLRQKAITRRDELARRHAIPQTRTEGDELVDLIVDLQVMANKDRDDFVTYYQNASPTAEARPMSVGEALPIAKSRLVNLFWWEKISQYIEQARTALDGEPPRPRLAYATLKAWESLPGLNDPRINLPLPDSLQTAIKTAEARIRPELEKLQAAENYAALARQEVNQGDINAAFSYWVKARDAYPRYEELGALRKELLKGANTQARKLLEEAQKFFTQEEWSLCQVRLQRLKSIEEVASDLDSDIKDQIEKLRGEYTLVQPVLPDAPTPLSLSEEETALKRLARRFAGSYWEGWTGLKQRLSDVEALGNVESLLKKVGEATNTQGTQVELEQLLAACKELMEPQKPLSGQDRPRVQRAVESLAAWLGYAQARDELQKGKSDQGDNDDDVSLEAPDLHVVREGITAARADPRVTAALRTSKFEEQLQRLERNDTGAQTFLNTAAKPVSWTQDELRDALEKIQDWLTKPTSYRQEFLEQRRDHSLRLSRALNQEIATLIERGAPTYYAQLSPSTLRKLRTELAALPFRDTSARSNWPSGAKMDAVLAVAEAHELAEPLKKKKWEEREVGWQQAYDAAKAANEPDLAAYCLQQAMQARKQALFAAAEKPGVSAVDAEIRLRQLRDDSDLAQDWEVWYRHGEQCLKLAIQEWRATSHDGPLDKTGQLLSDAVHSLDRAQELAQADSTLR